MQEPTIAIIGTLDTKEPEFEFLAERIRAFGAIPFIIDCGVMADPHRLKPDVPASEVAQLGGTTLSDLRKAKDRGKAVSSMGVGARVKINELHATKRIHGVIGAGGSGNTSITATAIQDLPVGFPKLIVSTMASGDTSPYVGVKDVAMMYSVGDIEGLNRLTLIVLNQAAAAITGMARAEPPKHQAKPTLGITMFGVTTPAVKAIRSQLESKGFEVLVFHATGTGGRAMEALIEQGIIQGAIDLTTTEVADQVVGGVLSAGPERLKAGVRAGIPQVISVGALDMVNFGPKETVPAKFTERNLYIHNPQVTLMRTTPDENRAFADFISDNLQGADPKRVSILLPLRGVSMIDAPNMPFYDPIADQALFERLMNRLEGKLDVVRVDAHINDESFADAVVKRFLEHWEGVAK